MGAHSGFGRLVLGLVVAATIAIGLGAVVVLHGRDRTSRTPNVPERALPSPKLGLTGILGVLRRPQTATDLDPALLRQLEARPGGRLAALQGTPVRSLIRFATVTPWGDKVYLVPYRAPERRTIQKGLARLKLPAARRQQELRRLTNRGYVLGLFELGAGSGCCSSSAGIEAGRAASESGPSPNAVVLVVPDGVAKITVLLRHTVTARVDNNVASFVVHQPVENLNLAPMIWYGPSGAIVNRFGLSIPAESGARKTALRQPRPQR